MHYCINIYKYYKLTRSKRPKKIAALEERKKTGTKCFARLFFTPWSQPLNSFLIKQKTTAWQLQLWAQGSLFPNKHETQVRIVPRKTLIWENFIYTFRTGPINSTQDWIFDKFVGDLDMTENKQKLKIPFFARERVRGKELQNKIESKGEE